MQSEFDSDEFDREGNRLHYEEDSDSDRFVIDDDSEFYDQRRRKTPEAREDSKYQQFMEDSESDRLAIDEDSEYYHQRRRKTPEAREDVGNQHNMEGNNSDGLVLDYSFEDDSVFKRNMANSEQRLPISPPLQARRVPEVIHFCGESDDEEDEEEEVMEESEPGSPVEVDLKYLAPVRVEETHDWPKPIRISNVRLGRNKNFDGDWKEEMRDVNSDHYKTKDHFVWTNQLVVGRGVELNVIENWLSDSFRNKRKIINNPLVQRFPENYFSLKKAGDFGDGLFAKRFIEDGTVIGEYTGELITREERLRRHFNFYQPAQMSNYVYETRKAGLEVDAGAMGNHTRFINHSCDGGDNCAVFVETIEGVPKIWVVAIKDIQQGQELFLDYGPEYFADQECLCKGDNCVERKKEEKEKERKRLEDQKWMG